MPAPDYADEYAAARASVRAAARRQRRRRSRRPSSRPAPTGRCTTCAPTSSACRPRSSPATTRPPGDNQEWVDRHVAERADRSVAELLDEWDAVGPAFEGLMRKLPRAFGGLVYDAVAHEHDLRGALGPTRVERDAAGRAGQPRLLVADGRARPRRPTGRRPARCALQGRRAASGSSGQASRRCR